MAKRRGFRQKCAFLELEKLRVIFGPKVDFGPQNRLPNFRPKIAISKVLPLREQRL